MAKSTLYVAANDAPAADKARADYTCDGTADNTEIQAAITALQGQAGGAVLLSTGTFNLATRLTIAGANNVDVEQDIMLMGSGPSNTTLVLGTGQASAIEINACAKVHLHNFRVDISAASSTAHGISSTAGNSTADYRSFWQSSFKNLSVIGNWDSPGSGYAFHLDSPFRSVFENIEVGGCNNGFRLFSTNSDFNPGDCTFQRIFCDLVGNNSFAYKIESTDEIGNMNQIEFVMCEAIASGTGCTGIYLGGTGPVTHTKWHGINLEQFDTCLNIANGEGNQIDGNYWELRLGATGTKLIQFGAGAVNNWVRSIGMWYSENTSVMITSAATDTDQPNLVEHIKLLNDSGTHTNSPTGNMASTSGATIAKWIVADTGAISGLTVPPA